MEAAAARECPIPERGHTPWAHDAPAEAGSRILIRRAAQPSGVEPLVVQLLELPLNSFLGEDAPFFGFPKDLVVLPT